MLSLLALVTEFLSQQARGIVGDPSQPLLHGLVSLQVFLLGFGNGLGQLFLLFRALLVLGGFGVALRRLFPLCIFTGFAISALFLLLAV